MMRILLLIYIQIGRRETIKSSSPVQDYSISLNGTSGDTQYMMSGGVYLQDGLLSNYDYNKYTFRTNLQHKFNNFIKLGTHMRILILKEGLQQLLIMMGH